MHAWIATENPAGVWASENWALPYVRLGVATSGYDPLEARVLSLATGGDYYLRAIAGTAQLDDHETARVERVLAGRGRVHLAGGDVNSDEARDGDVATCLDPLAVQRRVRCVG